MLVQKSCSFSVLTGKDKIIFRAKSRGTILHNTDVTTLRAVTKSGTGTWDLGREDSGTPGRGTRGHGDLGRGDVGLGDAGTRGRGDSGTWDSGTWGRGDVGTWDAGTWGRGTRGRGDVGREDVINKKQFLLYDGAFVSRSVAYDFQRP